MPAHRPTLVLAAALAVAPAAVADAAPARKPPVCRQLVDAAGDAKAFGAVGSRTLDILSADIATGSRNLVVALRMATFEQDPLQTGGVTFGMQWLVGGARQGVTYDTFVNADPIARFDPTITSPPTPGDEVVVPFVVDTTTNTITWSVPRRAVAALRKPGARFTSLAVRTYAGLNHRESNGEGHVSPAAADQAQSGATYVDHTRTCLKGT